MIRHAGLAALVGAAACWGLTVISLGAAAQGLGTSTMTAIELASAVAVLGATCVVRRVRLPHPTTVMLLAGGLEPGLAYVLLNAGIARTSGAHASLIIGTEAAAAVFLSALAARRTPPVAVCLGLLLACGGAAAVAGGGAGGASLRGDLLVAAGVVAAAAYVVLAQRLSSAMSPLALTTLQFTAGTALTVPLLLAGSASGLLPPFDWAPAHYLALAAGSGVAGSTVAFGLYNWALARVRAAQAATSLALIPVFGVGFSALLLGDPITARTIWAAAAVVVRPSFLGFKKVLDHTTLEKTIERQSGGALTNVACPAGEKVKAGNTFQCSAAGGKKVTVTIKDRKADYVWTPSG